MIKHRIKLRMEPEKIFMLDNIIEGYDGLGIVSTGNPKLGEVVVHVTPDTYDEVREIIRNLPWPVTVLQ